MLRALTIKNFRGFRELKIEPLARVNLIAGKNNVGFLKREKPLHTGLFTPHHPERPDAEENVGSSTVAVRRR